jgi:hypothetical protein
LDSGIQDTITIDNNKTKLLVIVHQRKQGSHFKGSLTAVGESCKWLERLNVKRNLLFTLAITSLDNTAEKCKAICWDVFVKS